MDQNPLGIVGLLECDGEWRAGIGSNILKARSNDREPEGRAGSVSLHLLLRTALSSGRRRDKFRGRLALRVCITYLIIGNAGGELVSGAESGGVRK